MNLVLYLVPIFMLISGSFGIANEQENGQWRLLSTYPVGAYSYVLGKLGGQLTAQTAIFTLAYSLSMIGGLLFGQKFTLGWAFTIYLFSILLLYLFLMLGIFIGSFSVTRWQALSVSVGAWFLLIMMWPTALISVMGFFPYQWIEPLMNFTLFLNPAELLRFAFVAQLDGGIIFGQSYDTLIDFLDEGGAVLVAILYILGYSVGLLGISALNMERKKRQ